MIDHHIIDAISILGLILGVMGSMYLTYDLLGRSRQGPLQWIVRFFTPAILGLFIVGLLGIGEYWYVYRDQVAGAALELLIFKGGIVYGLVGFLIGAYNGLFAPNPEGVHRPPLFSLRNGAGGLVLSLIVWYIIFVTINLPPDRALLLASQLALLSGLAAGLWGYLTYHELSASDKSTPPLFSWRGFFIGLFVALLLGFFSAVIANISVGATFNNSVRGALLAGILIGLGGGITGGLSRYIFWRALNLKNNQLGAIGVMLTLLGFVAQLIPSVLNFFN